MDAVLTPGQVAALDPDRRYRLAADTLGAAVARLAAGYEADPADREDLVQEIHLQLWRSLKLFDGRCSLRSWVYRVAHNVAADHVARATRWRGLLDIDALEDRELGDQRASPEEQASARLTLDRLLGMIRRLRPIDRQVMLLYLEDEDTATITEVTGLSAGAVATRIHRIKALLASRLQEGGPQ